MCVHDLTRERIMIRITIETVAISIWHKVSKRDVMLLSWDSNSSSIAVKEERD